MHARWATGATGVFIWRERWCETHEAGAARTDKRVHGALQVPMGKPTTGAALKELFDRMAPADWLHQELTGNVFEVAPSQLDAANKRAMDWSDTDVKAHAAGRRCELARHAQEQYYNMTGRACLFWRAVDDPVRGEGWPALLMLYVPGSVLRRAGGGGNVVRRVAHVRQLQQRLLSPGVLNQVKRGPRKERGGVTWVGGYRCVETNPHRLTNE